MFWGMQDFDLILFFIWGEAPLACSKSDTPPWHVPIVTHGKSVPLQCPHQLNKLCSGSDNQHRCLSMLWENLSIGLFQDFTIEDMGLASRRILHIHRKGSSQNYHLKE